MRDPRIDALAKVLVEHSMDVKTGDNILLNLRDYDRDMACALIEAVYHRGGRPFVNLSTARLTSLIHQGMDETMIKAMAEFDARRMERMQGYVSFAGGNNALDMMDVPQEKTNLYRTHHWKVMDEIMRRNGTRWVVVEYPTPGAAQNAGMSTGEFEDFFFSACCVDYQAMSRGMDALADLMERTRRVEIKGPGTDLSFEIGEIPVVKCDGIYNVPDGEVFTAPVRESVNGTVAFNADSVENGFRFSNIRLTFQEGKCVAATCNDDERLNRMLDLDPGARYIGEFSLGVNPAISRPMLSTLFDEKIAGSFHLAMGACYDEAPNGNESAIHWDLVCIQTPEYGGGEIYFDGKLIRRDGIFVEESLCALNPQTLARG